MKRWLVLVLLLVLSCSRPPPIKQPEPEPLRSLDLTLHTDVRFNGAGRKALEMAAERWFHFTDGRVRFRFVFDLSDGTDVERNHDLRRPVVVGTPSDSPLGEMVDAAFKDEAFQPLAATFSDPPLVVFVVDRILAVNMVAVAMHELGHLAGLPDLPEPGAIMSGKSMPDEVIRPVFAVADHMLCRAYKFCN